MRKQSVKIFRSAFTAAIFLFCHSAVPAQQSVPYWYNGAKINSYRLPPADNVNDIRFEDLDKDGDPDVMRYNTSNGFPVLWIDDDDDMKKSDTEGDLDNDCLMADVNKDGKYGSYSDVVVDWVDSNNDGKADIQIFSEFSSEKDKDKPWGPGHFMVNMDLDKDNILNYIDWNTFQVRCWIHDGKADFYEDYSGQSLFLKVHSSPEKINDLRLNWENPFLFYDSDGDGLSEYAFRLLDQPVRGVPGDKYLTRYTGKISYVTMSYDMDNDNSVANPFDFDMTINFRGEGFDYTDQMHRFNNLRGLPAADQYFMDPRIRQLEGFIYPDHDAAAPLTFNKGKWNQVWFVYDEDDDAERWERVELYEALNMFATGARKGGLDNNPQADAAGDRGEWDLDNSGKGNLYIGRFDGRIHLHGAEWGSWRIDQNAYSFQGWGGLYDGYGSGRTQAPPKEILTVKYTDTDNNGFLDQFEYDLNGDTIFEHTVSLKLLGIDDKCDVINTSGLKYKDMLEMEARVAENMWKNAQEALAVAQKAGINPGWYSLLMSPKSLRQKYHQGYWLQFYIYRDLLDLAARNGDTAKQTAIAKAYFQGKWSSLK